MVSLIKSKVNMMMIKVETLNMDSRSSISASILDKRIKTPVQWGLLWPYPCYPCYPCYASAFFFSSKLSYWPPFFAPSETEAGPECEDYSLECPFSWLKFLWSLFKWCDYIGIIKWSWTIAEAAETGCATILWYWLYCSKQNYLFIWMAW